MKKFLNLTFVFIFVLTFTFFVVSCGKGGGQSNSSVGESPDASESASASDIASENGLKFSVKGAVLEVGETFVIEYEKIGDGEIEWKSSDENVVTVENGTIEAVGEGVAEVVGKIDDTGDKFTVKVEKQTSVPSLKLSGNEAELIVGESTFIGIKAEYKGKEVQAELYGINIVEGGNLADVSLNGASVSVSAKSEGVLRAVVYAKISGVTAAERLTVNIRKSIPFIVVSNAKPAADGYEIDVAAVENPDVPIAFKPKAEVWNNGKIQKDAEIEWTLEENDFIGHDESGYYGKTAGSVVVIGTYGGESVRLTVNCVRPVFARTDEVLTVELADGLGLNNIAGTVESVKAGDTEIFDSVDADGAISFKLNALKTSEYNVEKKITISTDKATYEYVGKIYTDIITDESELNDFLKNSLASATASMSANGYFVLGNDIVCTGEYKAYDRYPFGAQSSNGFQGVFDGNGKIIKNLNVTGDYCGFIPMLGGSGVIKNVIFLNGKLSGNGGFISCHSWGTVENVYIEAAITDNSKLESGDRRMFASVLASESTPNMIVKNVFVKYLNVVDENANAGHLFVLGDCKPEGLIVVGHKKYHIKTWGSFSGAKARTYLTAEELAAAKADWAELVSGYSSLIFNVTNTGILPARSI